ncbi:phosphatase phospho-type [Chytridium lagenaria]|nr:phosphatase phospho-type [Chytridium lagenaria]
MSQKKPLLAAFDFDWTVIDDDSDHWVINKLSETQAAKMKELSGKVQWTDLMGMLLKGLHAEGVTSEDIIKKLGEIPFNPAMVGVFETIKAAGGDIIIVSDANTIFIEEILIAKNIRHFITEIVTNPGTWDSSGCLTVQRRIKSTDAPHNCQSICAINLCKGNEMTIRFEGYERFIYGGDGRNDYCPMTKLSTADAVFPRRGHSLEKYLTSNKLSIEAITASIHWWSSSEDLLAAVKTVLA